MLKVLSANRKVQVGEPVKVGVLVYKFDDAYISEVSKSLIRDSKRKSWERLNLLFLTAR